VSNATARADAGDRLRVLVLGSTGSIGTQALEIIAANPDRFEVVGLAAGGANPDMLQRQRAETGVSNIAVTDERAAQLIGDVPFSGPEAVTRLVVETPADVVPTRWWERWACDRPWPRWSRGRGWPWPTRNR